MYNTTNISLETFSVSTVVIGCLLIDDTTANEKNVLGNWLKLVTQVLTTNAYFQQVQAEKGNYNNQNSNNQFNNNFSTSETIILMQKMIQAMQMEIENLKKKS